MSAAALFRAASVAIATLVAADVSAQAAPAPPPRPAEPAVASYVSHRLNGKPLPVTDRVTDSAGVQYLIEFDEMILSIRPNHEFRAALRYRQTLAAKGARMGEDPMQKMVVFGTWSVVGRELRFVPDPKRGGNGLRILTGTFSQNEIDVPFDYRNGTVTRRAAVVLISGMTGSSERPRTEDGRPKTEDRRRKTSIFNLNVIMRRFAAVAVALLLTACEKTQPPAKAPATPAAPAEVVAPPSPALLAPDPAKVDAAGPDSFAVHVVTTKGPFDLKVRRSWSPKGADRLYYLVSNGYYDGIRFYRVISGFMAQFGAAGDTAVARAWRDRRIADDPVKHGNTRGTLTFATAGPNTRTTQLFINYANNAPLDAQGFSPVGEVTNGMNVVDSLYSGYGEGAPNGRGPDQGQLAMEGNAYLVREFPQLDHIVTARVTEEWKKKP